MKKNIPLYHKIYNYFKEKILNEDLKDGEALPSERKLMEFFNVSRSTIRQALKKLEIDNFIYIVHGSGAFVSNKTVKQELSNFYSFYEEFKKMGKRPTSKILGYKIINKDEKLSEIFKIPLKNEILYIKRLRLVDEIPLIYEETYLPLNRFKNFNVDILNSVPMYTIFRDDYNVVFEKATESFSASILEDKEILKHLNYSKKISCMLIKRLTYEKGNVIEYTVSYAKGDKFEYKVTLNNV